MAVLNSYNEMASIGFLLAEDVETKESLELHPDSNSLNFWEGFISRKLPQQ